MIGFFLCTTCDNKTKHANFLLQGVSLFSITSVEEGLAALKMGVEGNYFPKSVADGFEEKLRLLGLPEKHADVQWND